jgi:hypothetical protein
VLKLQSPLKLLFKLSYTTTALAGVAAALRIIEMAPNAAAAELIFLTTIPPKLR